VYREIPFEFIFDYLLPIETTVKPYFGMLTAIRVCELIAGRDPRIGKIPPMKRKRKK